MRNKLWLKIVIGVVVLGVIAAVAVPYIYIHFIKDDAPDTLSLDDAPVGSTSDTSSTSTTGANATTTAPAASAPSTADTASAPAATAAETTAAAAEVTTTAAAAAATTYELTPDSTAGYRVVEVLLGQDTEGVGRTNAVTGSITVEDTKVTAATFTVDMATLKSDEDNRDGKFRGEIMETETYPTATFTITQPIELGEVPADGVEITATATGDLTLHGVTKPVTLEVQAKKTGDSIAIAGSTDVLFADYAIANPSNGAVTTQDHGLIEFLLVANKV